MESSPNAYFVAVLSPQERTTLRFILRHVVHAELILRDELIATVISLREQIHVSNAAS